MQLPEEIEDKILWCGNLHEDVTEEILFELFLQAGPVAKVKIIGAKDGKPSYAFITFEHCVSVAFARELMNGIQLYGKPIKLQLRNKSNNAPSEIMLKEHKKFNDDLKETYLKSKIQDYNASTHNFNMPLQQTFNFPIYNSWNPQTATNLNQQQWNLFQANFNANLHQNLFHFSGIFK